ncbi:MAG: transporter substrate-binding domain-containing protein [Pseudomonadota bacterium]
MRGLAALLWCLLCAPVAAEPLVIATTGTFPPYLWEEGDSVRGFDIDLMDEICKRNGFECEYRIYPLTPGLEAVANGEADIALGGIGITVERQVYGYFTCPYTAGSTASVPIFARDRSVNLATARIAVFADSLSHQALIDEGYTAVPFDNLPDAIRSVLNGETDAFHGNRNSLPLVPGAADALVPIAFIEGTGRGAGFLVSADRPGLLATMNDSLAIFQRDGRLQQIADRWYGPGRFAPPDAGACSLGVAQL